MFKKILTMGLFIVFLLPCVFANSKISLGDKALLISKTVENNNVYNEDEVVYDEDYEAYEDEEYEEEAEDTEYYDKNGKKVIFANSPSAKGRQSKSSNSRQQINIVSSNMNSNLALSPYNLTYYNEHKKTTLGAFGCSFLNFLLGLGIGSFFQGDDSAGGKFLATDLIALAVGGGCAFCCIAISHTYSDYDYYPSPMPTEAITPFVLTVLSGVTLLVSRICQIIRPYRFKEQYNNKLYLSLMGNNYFSMDIIPNVDSKFKITGATLVGKISF